MLNLQYELFFSELPSPGRSPTIRTKDAPFCKVQKNSVMWVQGHFKFSKIVVKVLETVAIHLNQ